jgi:hypothetical protein
MFSTILMFALLSWFPAPVADAKAKARTSPVKEMRLRDYVLTAAEVKRLTPSDQEAYFRFLLNLSAILEARNSLNRLTDKQARAPLLPPGLLQELLLNKAHAVEEIPFGTAGRQPKGEEDVDKADAEALDRNANPYLIYAKARTMRGARFAKWAGQTIVDYWNPANWRIFNMSKEAKNIPGDKNTAVAKNSPEAQKFDNPNLKPDVPTSKSTGAVYTGPPTARPLTPAEIEAAKKNGAAVAASPSSEEPAAKSGNGENSSPSGAETCDSSGSNEYRHAGQPCLFGGHISKYKDFGGGNVLCTRPLEDSKNENCGTNSGKQMFYCQSFGLTNGPAPKDLPGILCIPLQSLDDLTVRCVDATRKWCDHNKPTILKLEKYKEYANSLGEYLDNYENKIYEGKSLQQYCANGNKMNNECQKKECEAVTGLVAEIKKLESVEKIFVARDLGRFEHDKTVPEAEKPKATN